MNGGHEYRQDAHGPVGVGGLRVFALLAVYAVRLAFIMSREPGAGESSPTCVEKVVVSRCSNILIYR